MKESDTLNRNVTAQGYSIKDICTNLGVSKGFLVGQIKTGKLRARRLGRRVIVLGGDLDAYLSNSELIITKQNRAE
jgi:excisionase family DNA binding protein